MRSRLSHNNLYGNTVSRLIPRVLYCFSVISPYEGRGQRSDGTIVSALSTAVRSLFIRGITLSL